MPLDPRAYQAAFHMMGEAAAFVGADDALLAMNAAFTRLLGVPEPAPARFADVFPPAVAPQVEAFLRDAHRWSEASLRGVRVPTRGPVDLWADQFVDDHGDRLLLVRGASAGARLAAERLHEVSVQAARACNHASDRRQLFEGAAAVAMQEIPGATGTCWVRAVGEAWTVFGGAGSLAHLAAHDAPGLDALWSRLAREREPVLVADVAVELGGDQALAGAPLPDGSLVLSPILAEEGVDGLFLALGEREAAFTLEDLRCMEAITREMTSALRRLASHDDLARSHAALQRAFDAHERLLHQIRRQNVEMEDFALWTTHDLREPLRGLATLAAMAAAEAEEGDARELRGIARQLETSATRLKEHIRGLHDFHVHAKDSDVREVTDLAGIVRRVAASPGMEVRAAVPGGPVPVRADPARVEMALADVARYVSLHGKGPVRVAVAAREGSAVVSFALEAEVSRRAAEAAFHVVAPGASLALARRIALQHGGSLAFEREDGPCIRLVLPAAE